MQYFSGCENPGQVKVHYRNLAFKLHPDLHPSDEFDKWNRAMQHLNAEYHAVLQSLDGHTSQGFDGKAHRYNYNQETEQSVVDTIAATIVAKLPDHATVEIIGIYVWVSGLTRQNKEAHTALKANKFRYHSKRNRWYWKPANYRGRYTGKSFGHLRAMYGSRTVSKQEEEKPMVPA
jgi:hypothetical protein